MTVSLGQLKQWLDAPAENSVMEFKAARKGFAREKLFKYCVSIAEEGGGNLVLGVTGKKSRKVVGSSAFPNPKSIEHEVFKKFNLWVGVSEVNHPDGRVVAFQIPSRPKQTTYKLVGIYRLGANLMKRFEDTLKGDQAGKGSVFLEKPAKQGLDAQQVTELLDTHAYFDLLNQPYPSSRYGVIDKLVAERLIDRADGLFSIRRIGALLLADQLADFDELASRAPRVVVYNGPNKLAARREWTIDRGYAVGFHKLVDLVIRQVPQYERVERIYRKKYILVPEDAPSGLIANALIHQDFTVTGIDTVIEIYSNRVEISNPGKPMLDTDRFIDSPRIRNERLVSLMRSMGIYGKRSSGVDQAIKAVERAQLPALEFQVERNLTRVVIYGARKFNELTLDERIRACYQHCAIKKVSSEKMTNETLRKRFGLPDSKRSTVSAVIADTAKAKLIKKDDDAGRSRKHARYVPYWV